MTIKITQSLPEWDMERWLKFPFYKERCSNHPNKYKTLYCGGTCNLQQPVCPICWGNISDQHRGDRIMFYRASIEVTEIEKLINASEIQKYSINSKPIVFLNPNQQTRPSHSHCQPNQCRTCRRKLKADDQPKLRIFKFCSIACKIQQCKGEVVGVHMECDDHATKIEEFKEAVGVGVDMEMKKQSDDDAKKATILKINLKRKIMTPTVTTDECCPPPPPVVVSASLRKRCRKGIPHRAPFF